MCPFCCLHNEKSYLIYATWDGKNVIGSLEPRNVKAAFVFKNDMAPLLPLRHLQREIENQKAQANCYQQQMKKLDEDNKQNQVLLRRAEQEERTTKVTH